MRTLKKEAGSDWLNEIKKLSLTRMTNQAERELNPKHYQLSGEAKKRLRWLYLLYFEQAGNVTVAANKIGITRQWLSTLKSTFERKEKDPRSLEPESKAPHDTSCRQRIPEETEQKILEVRELSKNVWGKEKIARALERDHKIKVHPNTVNKYLHRHGKIDPKISKKNTGAWRAKKAREGKVELRVKYRPPKLIKDLAPCANRDPAAVASSAKLSDRILVNESIVVCWL